MADITVSIKVIKHSDKVYEIYGIMKGKFYGRTYIGYSRQKAIKLFEKWLGEQA